MAGTMSISAIKRPKLSFTKSGNLSKHCNQTYEILQKLEKFQPYTNKCIDKNGQLLRN